MSKVLERRNSFGTTTPTSSASASDSKKNEKTVSRYLRPSTGSCHDLCKHGHRNPSEEKLLLSGGRRKKLPTHSNNLTLHGSVILDAPKDVRNRRNISLVKSSISLGEADRVVNKIKSENLRGAASSEHLVPRIASSADHKNVNSDGRKKHPMVTQRTLANPRYSSGVPNFDKKAAMPVKGSKLPEKTLQEKARTVEKATTLKQPLVKKPASLPTKLNLIKKVPVSSQASNNLVSSRDKSTLKGKVPSSPAIITGKRTSNTGKTMRSSNASINCKERSDVPRTPFSIEDEFIASVELQEGDVESTVVELFPDATEYGDISETAPKEESRIGSEDGLDMSEISSSVQSELTASVETDEDDVQGSSITGHLVESALAEMSSHATEYVEESQPAPKETSRFSLEDGVVESNEVSEPLVSELPVAAELQLSFDNQELKTMLSKPDLEHMQPEKNSTNGRASTDEDIRTDDAALCQLPKQLTAVQNADVYDSALTESSSGMEADRVKVSASVESVITENKEDMGAHEDLQGPPELWAVDEKHAEDPEYCLDCTTGNVAENVEAAEIDDVGNINSTSHCQSILETSSDGELLEQSEPVPIDSNLQTDELASVHNNDTSEQDELKSMIVAQQLVEELSDDENYEEYDYELIELDDFDAEDEGEAINPNDESSKAKGQRLQRISSLHPDDASTTPYKLKFKRGKIVELTPDSNGPRRLVFRRRAANEVANGEGQLVRRIYKRNTRNNGVPTEPDLESPSVKLRHQDTQDKKDAQGLFNNVIEETASKLVESRKSKVKALVGAFETVILLQDSNPTTPQAGNSPMKMKSHGMSHCRLCTSYGITKFSH
ncbi:unnamed protein product [Triticum turgidum subsp. durum]|uniref:Calmodulin-binding domain-containing protein n=1 Tax=Triticum turgidum subsp. durum TaxID=4567 RepID=A0A9R0T9E7_TRITD|nr:unnamed protein product [Triticum turgidum subsp. durum]